MKEIARRTISLLLSFSMVLGVMPMNLLAGTSLTVNGTSSSSQVGTSDTGGTGSNTGGYTTHDFNATGYKIQLVFLDLPDDVYSEENSTERRKKIIKEWNDLGQIDLQGNKEDSNLKYIGDPVYLTTQEIYNKNAGRVNEQKTRKGYKYSDLRYGIGNKTGQGDTRTSIVDIKLSTPRSISGKYTMEDDLPIYISESGKRPDNTVEKRSLIRDYFLCAIKDEKGNTTYCARKNLAALVNYIANGNSSSQSTPIAFCKVANNTNEVQIIQENQLTGTEDSVFDTGVYQGMKGEYRLIISPYVSIRGGTVGNQGEVAVTLRDMKELDTECYSQSQPSYFKALAKALYFDQDDFFNMKGLTKEYAESNLDTSAKVAKDIENNKGIGIGLLSSDMVREELGSTNIGSITHIFLENDGVATASMEYIGAKNTDEAMQQLAGATLEVVRAGIGCEKCFIFHSLSTSIYNLLFIYKLFQSKKLISFKTKSVRYKYFNIVQNSSNFIRCSYFQYFFLKLYIP